MSKQRSEIERLGEVLGFRFKPREGRSDERKPPSWWCWCDEKKKKKHIPRESFWLILQNLKLICVIGTVQTYLGF